MKADISGLSKAGGRKSNQDAYGIVRSDAGFCLVVADGLGGHAGGEIASRMAVETVREQYASAPGVSETLIAECFRKVQAAILDRTAADFSLAGMRTTLVLLSADRHNAVWGHVGDSRLYWFREGRIIEQTRDHSVPQMLVDAGKIAPQEIRGHEDQNRLTRAVGQAGELRPKIRAGLFPVRPGDSVLLCSDGVWTYVFEAEMEADLAGAQSTEAWLERMERRILERAVGAFDNYTAVAVIF